MTAPASPGRFGDDFRLTLITRTPALAAVADACGVNRIGIDLERIGKASRQAGLDTRLSDHSVRDLDAIAAAVSRAALFARINPIGDGSGDEIAQLLDRGVSVLMLPYFKTAAEVEQFVRLVDGRALTVILLETSAAVDRLDQILAVSGVNEVMVGLNDLRLDLGVASPFELLASPLLTRIADATLRRQLAFSVGGVASPDDLTLPISPDFVLAQYPRLNATGAWISRSFLRSTSSSEFATSIEKIRQRLSTWAQASTDQLESACAALLAQAIAQTKPLPHADRRTEM